MIDDTEKQISEHIKADMEALSKQMVLYNDMRGAYAYKRAQELYIALGRVLVALDKKGD